MTYIVFDLPFVGGRSLFAEPLSLRRTELDQLIERFALPGVLVPEGVRTHGRELFAQVVRLGLEGIMAKRLDGPYLPGKRSGYWLKIKPTPALRSQVVSESDRNGINISERSARRRHL